MGEECRTHEDVKINKIGLMFGPKVEFVDSVPCGNIVLLPGFRDTITNKATIVSSPSSSPLINASGRYKMHYVVTTKDPANAFRLYEGKGFSVLFPIV
jgi:translation elongation factor EF-G